MPLIKTQAVSLKSQRWGEADRIVTFYTLEAGKVRGIAKGARRIKSKFGSSLEPFAYVEATFFEKRSETLSRISQVDILESFSELRESLPLMSAAARMVNLTGAVTAEREPGPTIFHALLDGLRSLREGHSPLMTTLVFQIYLLGLTGFRPQTEQCADCGSPFGLGEVRFSPTSGGAICPECVRICPNRCWPMSLGSLAFIRQARNLGIPLGTRLRASGQIRREVERIIEAYVRIVVGKRLPAVEFFNAKDSSHAYDTYETTRTSVVEELNHKV